MFVKICGTTNLADAELAVELGADALGFIFAPSKRRVTVEQAAGITQFLPAQVHKVGVFTEPDVAEIACAVRGAGLSAVQMHWGYDRGVVRALREALEPDVAVWQVIGYAVGAQDPRAAEERFVQTLRAAFLDEQLAVVLLDSVKDEVSGGQGLAFPWGDAFVAIQLAREAAARIGGSQGVQEPGLVIAGGLRAENVADAIRALRPWGVDVVSGVEASPGRKSQDRLRAFFEAVQGPSGAELG